jgi:hypothetical protein
MVRFHAQACDVCGCGAGNLYFGIMPQWDKNMIGLRYRTISFQSHLYPNDPYADLFKSQENFRIVDLMGTFRVGQKWQISAFLPYAMAKQIRPEKEFSSNALADAMLQIQYEVVNSEVAHPEKDWKHRLQVGGGIKAPTGKWKYEKENSGFVENANFQPGTGSWDWLGTVQYVVRYSNSGIQTDAQYRVNGRNDYQYKFGNRLTGNANLFYLYNLKGKKSIMPFAGIYFEDNKLNKVNNYIVEYTGGQLYMANVGIQVFYNHLNINMQYQKPLRQNLSANQILAEDRLLFGLGWSF